MIEPDGEALVITYFLTLYMFNDRGSPTALLNEYFYSESTLRIYYTCFHMPSSSSRILPHIHRCGSHRIIRRRKIALMERAHLIRLIKRADNTVQHATVMEQDEILFLPVVRVHQLNVAAHE